MIRPAYQGHLPFRDDINGLRALSVLLVVLFHVHARGAGGGFIGVDIFFVISGYLMTRIILGGLGQHDFSYWRFLRARAARIWPALGALVIGLVIVGAILLPPSDLLQISRQALWPLLFWSNQDFRDHAGYATQGADGQWYLHTWSLSVEWQFYLLYPLLLMLLAPRIRYGMLRAWMAALFAASLALYVIKSSNDPNGAFFLLPARAWELLAGGLVVAGASPGAPKSRTLSTLASYSGLALILLSALWLGRLHTDAVGIGWLSLPPVLGAALVLWAEAHDNWLLSNPAAKTLGLWSYSIYLWHWPLVVICSMDAIHTTHPVVTAVIVMAGSLLLGGMSFRWIESSRQPLRPFLLMGIAALGATLGVATDGLRFRMPESTGALAHPARESDYFPAACSNFQKTIDQVHPCPIEHGGRRVLVIGDSLAESLWPWFHSHSIASVDFLTEADCPPVPHMERLQPGFHCMDYANLAWQQAAAERYDTVIVVGRWEMVGQIGPRYCHQDSAGNCRIVSGEERTQLTLQELHQAIASTLAAGKNVVVVQSSPEADVYVPARLERERYWFGAPRLSISAEAVTKRNAWIDSMLDTFSHAPGFYLVSFRPLLCDATACKTYDAQLKRPVYIDDVHFDPIWIEARAGLFRRFVDADAPHPEPMLQQN